MTGKEIVQMAFALERTPRLPVTLIGGGAWAVNNGGKTFAAIKDDPAKIAEVFIQYYHLFEHDLLWSGSNFLNYPISFLGCPIKDDSASYPALEGAVIKSLDEIEKLRMEKVKQNPIMQAIIHSHHLVADVIGKKTMIIPTQWAPFTFASRILGVEATMMATINDQDRLKKLIAFATELIWSLLEPVLEHPDIGGANFSDPAASGDLISPATFRIFAAPPLAELTRRLQRKGKYAMIHICGNTTKILEDVLKIKPNCFSLENKVDLRIAKEILGGKICVAGNVSPTGAFLSGLPEEVVEEAQACLQAWGKSPGYILTVGCDFAKEVPLQNMQALMSFKNNTWN
ncbi:MAG: uroporphyrinogen decarboxylase family protein [Thermodesulfobacteriota bacterium]